MPTLKVSSNSALAETKPGWIDYDAGRVLESDAEAMVGEFAAHVLAVASGQITAAERDGQRAIAIWKRGVTL